MEWNVQILSGDFNPSRLRYYTNFELGSAKNKYVDTIIIIIIITHFGDFKKINNKSKDIPHSRLWTHNSTTSTCNILGSRAIFIGSRALINPPLPS